jgi:hypothetical protein
MSHYPDSILEVVSEDTTPTLGVSYSQEFRLRSPTGETHSSRTMAIPARWDAKCGHYVILWMDIQLLFKDIRHIMHGNSVVHFIMDNNSRK